MLAKELIAALKMVPEDTEILVDADELGEIGIIEFAFFDDDKTVLLGLEPPFEEDDECPAIDPTTGRPIEDDEVHGEVVIIPDDIDPETLTRHGAMSATKEKKKQPVIVEGDYSIVDDIELGV